MECHLRIAPHAQLTTCVQEALTRFNALQVTREFPHQTLYQQLCSAPQQSQDSTQELQVKTLQHALMVSIACKGQQLATVAQSALIAREVLSTHALPAHTVLLDLQAPEHAQLAHRAHLHLKQSS